MGTSVALTLPSPYLGYKGLCCGICRIAGNQLINTALVGIKEDHVESTALLGQLKGDMESSAENDFNIKAVQVFHCNLSVLGIDFNTTNFSAGLGEPDGGVVAERADLKDGEA